MAATPAERLDAIELLLLRVLARVDLLLEKDQRIMADQLTQSSAALSAAILANTPAAPPAPAPAA